MISLPVIMAFLTTIITLFFNSLSDTWKHLGKKAKDAYATSIQNFVEEVKKDFADKPAKRRMKELLEGWRAAITVGTNDSPFTRLSVTNFIRPYLHQFFNDSHGLNSYRKP